MRLKINVTKENGLEFYDFIKIGLKMKELGYEIDTYYLDCEDMEGHICFKKDDVWITINTFEYNSNNLNSDSSFELYKLLMKEIEE